MRFLVMLLALTIPASAFNQDGQYDDIPQHLRDWFKGQRSPHGVPCCDISDAHVVDEQTRPDGYWAFFEGEWRHIPPESIIYNSKNPNGRAVVWFVKQGADVFYVRCYTPGPNV